MTNATIKNIITPKIVTSKEFFLMISAIKREPQEKIYFKSLKRINLSNKK